MKIKSYINCICVALLTSIFCLSGCFLLRISEKKRAEIYDYYSNDDNYVEVYGKLVYNTEWGENSSWHIMFDEEFISENQELYNRWFSGKIPQGVGCEITDKNHTVLLENGFYDLLLDESEIDKSAKYPALIEETIYIVTSYCAYTEPWTCRPAVEVRVGGTVYLDYETGKANFLDYIQNDLR